MQNQIKKQSARPAPGPDHLTVITTAGGYFQPGLRGRIVGASDRLVYLGEPPAPFQLAEFTIELDGGGRREFCQYGRDFVFAPPISPSAVSDYIAGETPIAGSRYCI